MTTSTVWFAALVHTEKSTFLTTTALVPSVQMSTRQKRQVTSQRYYDENSFDLWDSTGSANHALRTTPVALTAVRNHVIPKTKIFVEGEKVFQLYNQIN